MSADAVRSYQEILRELEQLHRERKTGTARVATSDNQLLQVTFDNGEIVGVVMGLKQNLEAIKLYTAGAKTGRLKFSEGKPRATGGGGLPPTAGVLRMLGLTETLASSDSAPAAASTPTAMSVVEREAVEFLGPMASIVWEEQRAKVGDLTRPGALQKLVDALAQEIGNSGDAKKAQLFRTTLGKKLASR